MRVVSGSPRLGTINALLAETVILAGAGRLRRVRENRFLVRRALLEPDALGDHGLENLAAKDLLDLARDILRQRVALVVHRDHDAENLQRRIRPLPDFITHLEMY